MNIDDLWQKKYPKKGKIRLFNNIFYYVAYYDPVGFTRSIAINGTPDFKDYQHSSESLALKYRI